MKVIKLVIFTVIGVLLGFWLVGTAPQAEAQPNVVVITALQERVRLRKRERLMFPPPEVLVVQLETVKTADAGRFRVSRYYTPLEGQSRYMNGWKVHGQGCKIANLYFNPPGSPWTGDYTADLCMQGSGDPFITADGTDLRNKTPFTVLACPAHMKGKKFIIEGFEEYGAATCHDTGGAIKGNRIDLWVGLGEEGIQNYVQSENVLKEKGNFLLLTEIL